MQFVSERLSWTVAKVHKMVKICAKVSEYAYASSFNAAMYAHWVYIWKKWNKNILRKTIVSN